MVAELLCESNDYETANTILQAADIRTPYGTLERCYDSQGIEYIIPLYCFSLPRNLISPEEARRRNRQQVPHKGDPVSLTVKFRICGTVSIIRLLLYQFWSKALALYSSRFFLLQPENMEQDVQMQFKSDQPVSELKNALHKELKEVSGYCSESSSLYTDFIGFTRATQGKWDEHKGSPNKWAGKGLLPQRQRLMYQGRELIDEHHLQQAKVDDNCFIQVFIRPM
jgi:hypothetical protein